MASSTRNTDGLTPHCALGKRRASYPAGASLEAMTETWLLLNEALDAADPNNGISLPGSDNERQP